MSGEGMKAEMGQEPAGAGELLWSIAAREIFGSLREIAPEHPTVKKFEGLMERLDGKLRAAMARLVRESQGDQ